MPRRVLLLLTMLLASALAPASLNAQTAEELLTQARTAFENLEFEAAARLYARVLNVGAGATRAQRDTAQLYLGVSYEFAGQRDNTLSAFRALIRDNPCASTPEDFGGSVRAAFIEAMSQIFAASFCGFFSLRLAPSDTAEFTLAVTRPATVRVLLLDSSGAAAADFGEQDADGVSLVRWSTIPELSRFPSDTTRYDLVIDARERQGTGTDRRSIPVAVHVPGADTIPHPHPLADSLFRPERRPASRAWTDLAGGLLIGAGTAAAAAGLSYTDLGGEVRKAVVVGGTISVAGAIAFVRGITGRTMPENVSYNAQLRQEWQDSLALVVTANESRRLGQVLVIERFREQE